MKKILPSLLTLFSISFAYAGETPQAACNQYYQLMQSLPHIKVTYEKNKEFMSFENKPYHGCSVLVETKWSLVGKDFTQSSVLELPNWTMGSFAADGPGSSLYVMLKNNLFCMVRYDFSSYLDEKTNLFVTGDNLTMHAQCAEN